MSELAGTLGTVGTSAISDAMDKLGIAGQCLGIAPISREFHVVGRAFTVRYGPTGVDGGTVGDYIDELGPGDVVVLDNAGRLDCTVWGDLLTSTASHRGVAGTVIDGVCRDSDRSLVLGYPIYARGVWMRTGKDRVRVEEIGGVVSVGGARVRGGDWMIGDSDGVVAVPAELAERVAEAALVIAGAEDRIRAAVMSGTTLREARTAENYHSLQTKSTIES